MGSASQTWRFFRAGGFDQVRLDTAAELLSIDTLDQKLWVALSCPVKGIEFDTRTLELLDSDADGHIRAPELIGAVQWLKSRLTDTSVLTQNLSGIPLSAIRSDDEEGQLIMAAARVVASAPGRSNQNLLSAAETSAAKDAWSAMAMAEWEAKRCDVPALGNTTADAYANLISVTPKINDYFVRCQLAAFDPSACAALNASEDAFKALASLTLQADSEGIALLPLAHVSSDASLSLLTGINPAWASRMSAVQQTVITPLLGEQSSLTAEQWLRVKDAFAPYAAWLSEKPDAHSTSQGVYALEKLAHYVRDLHKFANNFVAFKDFYTRQDKATFQMGTLYIDGRSCDLCVAVQDVAKHTPLATLSRMCLVYCECVRAGQKAYIAAAFTAGDSDQLIIGRNGVFYDRKGQDWDATIIKIIDHPISLRQSFWSPYKKLARMVGTQLQKVAATKALESENKLGATTLDAVKPGAAAPTKAPATPAPFDVAKFAGVFAAIGLAVGAIGTALASVVTGLFALTWWQIPMVLAGVVLAISGPSVVLAWLKLRNRNLGPLLDANGWAINARACINIPFGTALTELAKLPANAERSMVDPYAEKPSRLPSLSAGLLVVAALAAAVWMYLKQA